MKKYKIVYDLNISKHLPDTQINNRLSYEIIISKRSLYERLYHMLTSDFYNNFDNVDDAQKALETLVAAGFDREKLFVQSNTVTLVKSLRGN